MKKVIKYCNKELPKKHNYLYGLNFERIVIKNCQRGKHKMFKFIISTRHNNKRLLWFEFRMSREMFQDKEATLAYLEHKINYWKTRDPKTIG